MTATYDTSLGDNVSLVRFHIGDTDTTEPRLSDEEITYMVTNTDSLGLAVAACINALIAQLSVPNFTADWLTVDHASARAGYYQLLAIKRREFGLSGISAKFKPVYRQDSAQTESPDYASASQADPSFPYSTR
jgi:hypothetical protein